MLHTKFRENQPVDSGEDFEGFFTTYGRGGHLGHVTSIMSSDFHFLVPESFHTKFGSDRYSFFSEKIQFEVLYVNDLWPRSRNDRDLRYSQYLLIRCLLLYLSGHRLQ